MEQWWATAVGAAVCRIRSRIIRNQPGSTGLFREKPRHQFIKKR
jgi:hypothetical protein